MKGCLQKIFINISLSHKNQGPTTIIENMSLNNFIVQEWSLQELNLAMILSFFLHHSGFTVNYSSISLHVTYFKCVLYKHETVNPGSKNTIKTRTCVKILQQVQLIPTNTAQNITTISRKHLRFQYLERIWFPYRGT